MTPERIKQLRVLYPVFLVGKSKDDYDIKNMNECLDAIESLSTPQWRPISEAPKDGKEHILLWPSPNTFSACGEIGFYWEGLPRPWITKDGRYWDNDKIPTHWMPLPPPPTSESGK